VLITDYTQRIDEEKDSKGKVHASLMGTGTVTVSVRRGTAQPSVREFIEREKLQDDTSASRTPELVRWVAQSLATQIAFLITPRRYQDTIVLDDSSEAVKPALGLIVEDKLDEAQAALLALLERTPDDAAAHYNLGVLAELREALPAARERYVRAVQLSPTSLRQEAVERVDRVEAEQRALE
jgi:tetratricopeptide (TPR) repeat protein